MKPQDYPIVLIALAALFALGGCGKVGAKNRAKSDPTISSRLEAIHKAGYPVTLSELNSWYPEPPAAENAAQPYADAFAALTVTDAKSPSFLAQNQPVLALLHKAAAKTQCRYPIDLSEGSAAKIPHLTKIRACAQLLNKDTINQAAKGRFDLAANDVLDGLRLAQSLEQEPLLISQLVRINVDVLSQSALEESLTLKSFPNEQMVRLQAGLREREDAIGTSLIRAFAGERCIKISLFQMPLAEIEKLAGSVGTNFSFGSSAEFDQYRQSALGSEDLNLILDYFSNWLAICSTPFPGCMKAAAQWAPLAEAKITDAKGQGLRVSSVLSSLNSSLERAADCIGQSRAAQAALAVECYRLTTSSALPDTLAQLVPKFLPAVPADPYDGKSLRYKKLSPRGYVIYSLGRNRQDDGGTPRPPNGQANGPYDMTFVVRR